MNQKLRGRTSSTEQIIRDIKRKLLPTAGSALPMYIVDV